MKKRIQMILAGLLVALGLVAIAGVPAYATGTTYPNCPANVGCIHTDKDGGGITGIISVGNTGYNTCWNMSSTFNNQVSSASADYGGGWDLKLFYFSNCELSNVHDYIIHSSHFVNFTGGLFYLNDNFSSYRIEQDF